MTFSELPIGDLFTEDGTVYEKIGENLARGPKKHPLGTGVYDFEADDEVGAQDEAVVEGM